MLFTKCDTNAGLFHGIHLLVAYCSILAYEAKFKKVHKQRFARYSHNFFSQKLAKITATVATALYQLANDGQPPKYEIKVDNDTEAVVSICLY